MIPFFAFALGNTIDLHSLLSPLAGLGVVLALSVIVLTGAPLIVADKLIGRGTGTAGIAASSTAGAAAANPVAIAAVAPQFAPAVQQATVLVAMGIVVTLDALRPSPPPPPFRVPPVASLVRMADRVTGQPIAWACSSIQWIKRDQQRSRPGTRLNSQSPARSRPSPWRLRSGSRSRSAAARAPSG